MKYKKEKLLHRLRHGNPGWREYSELISLVESLKTEFVVEKYMPEFENSFLYNGDKELCFEADAEGIENIPEWLPSYVPALYGMKRDYWETAGGYAGDITLGMAVKGEVFGPSDEELSFPVIEVPENTLHFMSNSHGAMFYINPELDILYSNNETKCFEKLDELERFTKGCIRQTLQGELWWDLYCDKVTSVLVD